MAYGSHMGTDVNLFKKDMEKRSVRLYHHTHSPVAALLNTEVLKNDLKDTGNCILATDTPFDTP